MASIFGRGVSAQLFFGRADSEVGSSSPLLCGGRTEGAAPASYHIGRGTFDLGMFYFFVLQSKPVFCLKLSSALRGLSHRRGHNKEFRHLGWAPLVYHNPVSQAGTFSRSAGQLQVFVQAYHAPSSVRQQRFNCYHTRVYHTPNTPWGCSDVLSHPLFITPPHLPHPQTHLVGVRTSYHTPWFITAPLGPLRAALCHPGYTRYHTPHRIPHPVMIVLYPKSYNRGVLSCVSYGIYRLPPKKEYHVYTRSARSTHHYAYARQTQVNWKQETKKRKEDKDIVCGYVAAFEIRIKRGLSIVLHDTSGIPRKQLPESEKTKFHFVPLLVVFLGTRGTHRSTHSTRRNTAVRGCQTEMSLSLDCCCTVTVTK